MTRVMQTPVLALIFFCAATSGTTTAQYATVEIAKIRVVSALSGTVRDPSGAPIQGATVAEISPDGKVIIQTTTTDQAGTFAIVSTAKKKVYDLRISSAGFNPLIVHLRVSKWTKKLLSLKLELST